MDENKNKIRLYSYSKVWKVEKKVYSFWNIVLPVPVSIYDVIYFLLSFGVIFIAGNMLPFMNKIPVVIQYIFLPYGITTFLRKKKLDGKNPVKYFIGYIYYIFGEKNTYMEKFKTYRIRKEERFSLGWFCSRGRSKNPSGLSGKMKEGRTKKKKDVQMAADKVDPDLTEKKTEISEKPPYKAANIHIIKGPKLKPKNITTKKNILRNKAWKQFDIAEVMENLLENIIRIASDPRIRKTIRTVVKKIFVQLITTYRYIKKKDTEQLADSASKDKVPELSAEQIEAKNKKEKKARPIKVSKEKKIPVLDGVTLLISVCSLCSASGCTHVAKSLAYFIKHEIKRTVCIVDVKGRSAIPNVNGIEIFNKSNFYDLYDRYDFIILDAGRYDTASHSLIKQAQIKIMCALMDEGYRKLLSEFVMGVENAKKWKYIFNHVPIKGQKEVHDLMESFDHWCMPVNDAMNFDQEMKHKFYQLLRGDRLS